MEKLVAWYGNAVARDENGTPVKRTKKGWVAQAKREAKKKFKETKIAWEGVVCYIPWRNAYRVSFGHQKGI